ncbi:helix-turn-helix domain-containing protein [bacterium]|nr:helix-turn-helix domain-containing protein [bacterium]
MATKIAVKPATQDWFDEGVATFGDRLEAAREAAGLTQKALAARLGVRDSTVKAWEADQSEPRANRMQMLAGMLNVSLGWLMAGVGEGIAAPADRTDDAQALAATLEDVARLKWQMRALTETVARVERRIGGQIGGAAE